MSSSCCYSFHQRIHGSRFPPWKTDLCCILRWQEGQNQLLISLSSPTLWVACWQKMPVAFCSLERWFKQPACNILCLYIPTHYIPAIKQNYIFSVHWCESFWRFCFVLFISYVSVCIPVIFLFSCGNSDICIFLKLILYVFFTMDMLPMR